MENEYVFEVGETLAFESDLFEEPVEGRIEKIYENSVMIRVTNCCSSDEEVAHQLHWQLIVKKSRAVHA